MDLIRPDWPAQSWIRAYSSTRDGGYSQGVYDGLNLGGHVGDEPVLVAKNRAVLSDELALPGEPLWLEQVHGCELVETTSAVSGCAADGAIARAPGQVCVVMTADCLPVLLCDREGTLVAAVHAGWRGLIAGVIDRAVATMGVEPDQILAWFGPAIGPNAFEVGPEVRDQFLGVDPGDQLAFRPSGDKWLADLYALARRRLMRMGITQVFGGEYCTYSDPLRFYSYRRDGRTGRMASIIWIEHSSMSL